MEDRPPKKPNYMTTLTEFLLTKSWPLSNSGWPFQAAKGNSQQSSPSGDRSIPLCLEKTLHPLERCPSMSPHLCAPTWKRGKFCSYFEWVHRTQDKNVQRLKDTQLEHKNILIPYLKFFNFGTPPHYLGMFTKKCVNLHRNSQNGPKYVEIGSIC